MFAKTSGCPPAVLCLIEYAMSPETNWDLVAARKNSTVNWEDIALTSNALGHQQSASLGATAGFNRRITNTALEQLSRLAPTE